MEIPVITGAYREIIPATPAGEVRPWFTNDHCFIRDEAGLWHCIGINNPLLDDLGQLYDQHPYLLHATAPAVTGPWTRRGFALDDSAGRHYLGAPFVVRHEGRYVMLFEAKWENKRGLEIAFSDDLAHWTRTRREAVTNQPPMRRDPCLVRDEAAGDWLLYLCTPASEGSTITVCRTSDFVTFSAPQVVLALADDCHWSSLESPFVVRRQGLWYLALTHSMNHYHETPVLVADRPDEFAWADQVTTLHAHAAEFIADGERWFISTCGPEDRRRHNRHGIELAPLAWVPRPQ
jgi:hypothetical protein